MTKKGFKFSIAQGQKMCRRLDAILSLGFMIDRGWLETTMIDGRTCIRFTAAGEEEFARHQEAPAA